MLLCGFRLVAMLCQVSEKGPLEVHGAGCPPHLRLQYACPYFQFPGTPPQATYLVKTSLPRLSCNTDMQSPRLRKLRSSSRVASYTDQAILVFVLRSPHRVCSKRPVRKSSKSS